jgi:hypothetical protein
VKRLLALGLALSLSAAPANAERSSPTARIVLSAGYRAPLNIPFIVFRGICGDQAVVRTEMRGGVLGVTGLKEGRTLCGYWARRLATCSSACASFLDAAPTTSLTNLRG